MSHSFTPPGITSLTDIDEADASYQSEFVVIQGIVSPEGQGGWTRQDFEVHCFAFTAWRRLGEAIVGRRLNILRAVPAGATYCDDFPRNSLQRIRVVLSDDETRAIFSEALALDAADEELLAVAQQLQKPVIIPTARFPRLTLDRAYDRFEGEAEWSGEVVCITLPADKEKPNEPALQLAESLWSNQIKWKERIEDYAVKEMLELKNEMWLEDNESQVTAADFRSRLTLTSISLQSDGHFEFWYDDGDLFWGHLIMVRANLNEGPIEAAIQG